MANNNTKTNEKLNDSNAEKDNKKTQTPKENNAEAEKAEKKNQSAADKESKALEAKAEDDIDDEDENEETDVDNLFKSRKSIDITRENAKFTRSSGNLISLEIINDEGEKEFFERVIILRSFPISNPDEFLSVREPDTRKKGRGKEIGMIRRISDLDEETVKIINDELNLRYFTPTINKITSVKEKFGYSYWEAETTAGKVTFVLDNPFSNIRTLEDGRIFISDMDGNIFQIIDPAKLDKASFRRIEVYI